MGDRVYGVVATDGNPGYPWHTGRHQEEFILYHLDFSDPLQRDWNSLGVNPTDSRFLKIASL